MYNAYILYTNIKYYYEHITYLNFVVLDFDWNDECIDFTMMCVFLFFFVSVITVWGSKTASIFFNSILFDGKVNLVGAFGRSNFKIPNRFQKRREKQYKN